MVEEKRKALRRGKKVAKLRILPWELGITGFVVLMVIIIQAISLAHSSSLLLLGPRKPQVTLAVIVSNLGMVQFNSWCGFSWR